MRPAVNAGEVLCDCADRWTLAKTMVPTTAMEMRTPPYMRRLRRARCRASSMSALTRASSSERVNESVELMDYASIAITMIRVKVNKSDPTDLYEQVAGEIRRAIADGEAKPGERLRREDLAAVLGVNTNTVLRSLRVLRDEGLLEFRRGRGISVAGTPERGAVVQRATGPSSSPAPRLPRGRAGRDHRERWLTKTLRAATRWPGRAEATQDTAAQTPTAIEGRRPG